MASGYEKIVKYIVKKNVGIPLSVSSVGINRSAKSLWGLVESMRRDNWGLGDIWGSPNTCGDWSPRGG